MPNNEQSDNATNEAVAKRRDRSAKAIFAPELLDQLLKNYSKPEDLTGPDGLLKKLTGALVERAMGAELTHHLGYEPGEKPPEEQTNRRNGTNSKTLRTEQGPITVEVPRDREGSFDTALAARDSVELSSQTLCLALRHAIDASTNPPSRHDGARRDVTL